MIRKFFPLDKNYLLENAQLSLQDRLLSGLVRKVLQAYECNHNPLRLEDAHFMRIRTYTPANLKPLYNFYQNLAGVYRYRFGENQLTFLWDGMEHSEKYEHDWSATFDAWITSFCQHELFLKAVLDLTVFLPENRHAHLAESRMNHFIIQHFEVRIHKNRGILEMKVA